MADEVPGRSRFPVREFRIARGDFNFVFGVGQEPSDRWRRQVTGAAAGTGGNIELAVVSTVNMFTNDVARVSSVAGTVEANGAWQITVVDATHILLQGSTFANAYTSTGGAPPRPDLAAKRPSRRK